MRSLRDMTSLSLIAALAACQPDGDDFFAGAPALESPASTERSARRDLATTISGPSTAETGEVVSIDIDVDNLGSRKARNVALVVTLDSSLVASGLPSGCAASGTDVACDLGHIDAGDGETVSFDVTAPASAGSHDIDAVVSTSSRESDEGNNSDRLSLSVAPPSLEIADGDTLHAAVCVSLSGPISWSDCVAGSLLYEALVFNGDGSMDLSTTAVSGAWSQDSSGELEVVFTNTADSSVMSTFTAVPVSSDCVEGTAAYSSGYGGWSGCLSGYPSL